MAITIKSYSFNGPTIAACPVYNPITFAIDSTRRTRESFSYVADIYYSGTVSSGEQFVTRLESYPNLTNYYGIFDVHRPLESYVSYDLNWNKDRVTLAPNSMKRFAVKFGEKFSTTNYFSSVGNSGGFLRLNFSSPHDLAVNDRVLIDKDYKGIDGNYDGVAVVTQIITSTQVKTDKVYGSGTTAQTGQAIEGTEFWDTYFNAGKVSLPCTNAPKCQVGDTIVVIKDNDSINPQYDGTWVVSGMSGTTVIETNIPWGSNSTLESGMVYIKGKKTLSGLTDSANYAWALNSVDDYDQRMSYGAQRDYATLYALSSSSKKFLTNAPLTQKVMTADCHSLSFLYGQDLLSVPTCIRLKMYYKSGGTRTNDFQMGTYNNTILPYQTRFDVGSGPSNIQSAATNSVISGGSINWGTIDYYEMYAYSTGSSASFSSTYTFDIDEDCSKYDTYRFMWLNRLGGFDYFNFRKRSDKSFAIEKQSYKRKIEKFQGDLYGYNIGDRGTVVNNVSIEENVSVFSDWVSETESEWLSELFTSPEVYIIDGNNIYPIVINNNEYVEGKRENQKLINYNVQFTYAFEKISQRG